MRLLTFGSLPPEWGGPRRGGVATFHASLLQALKARTDVKVVGVVSPTSVRCGLPVRIFVRPAGTGYAEFYESLRKCLRPDVILMNHVAHSWGSTHARLGGPVPALGFVHSWHNITFRSGAEKERARRLTQEALSGVQGLVTCSRHCLEEGVSLGLGYPALAEVVHHPLPPPYLDELDVDRADRHGVLFVGSLMERKDPRVLVEAASLMPDTSMSFAGTGELEAPLESLIAKRGLGARVTLLGSLGWHDVRERLLRSEVMCLPSRSESFGITYIEALACGTPVVGFAATVREIQAAMGMHIGEPLDTHSPEAVAIALDRVRSRGWDRKRLRERAVEVFGLERVTARLVELLRRTRDATGA